MKNPLCLSLLLALLCLAATCQKTRQPEGCIDKSKIDPDAMCIEIYEPVCGCNGETYSNSCYAEKAGVTAWTEGPCNDDN